MEESDEDVDVEDISDGEQISHLRYGTGGDQKNSWYDKEMGSQGLLASSSCSFSSDYCDTNSWLLDPNTVHCDSCFIDLLMLISKFDVIYQSLLLVQRKFHSSTVTPRTVFECPPC